MAGYCTNQQVFSQAEGDMPMRAQYRTTSYLMMYSLYDSATCNTKRLH